MGNRGVQFYWSFPRRISLQEGENPLKPLDNLQGDFEPPAVAQAVVIDLADVEVGVGDFGDLVKLDGKSLRGPFSGLAVVVNKAGIHTNNFPFQIKGLVLLPGHRIV